MKVLVTGGSGFIGSHFVRTYLKDHPTHEVVNVDLLTYAGRKENLLDVEKNPRYSFVHADICDTKKMDEVMKDCDAVVHFAAESHVDRAIQDAAIFLRTNVLGTHSLLEAARKNNIQKFLCISTDEVYGHILDGSFVESDTLNPRNPYAASKVGSERLAYSYSQTYGMHVVITRSSNNFGPYQFPEKMLPLFATNLIRGKKVPVYGDGMNIRDWLYVEDNCRGVDLVLQKGTSGEVYNIAGENEMPNLKIIKMILHEMGKGEDMIQYVEDRKGHDKRYSVNAQKIKALGFTHTKPFDERLRETLTWYRQNEWWWKPLVKQ
ncbi:MAG: dTDP-glucose 4,6-dehydratase [Candidatus Diapherotrites archaeon]|uniref:dTDP-glucose 4,6-dehydratase n=1 Tax=Candidatus Iainarchaeum sp. TaxID=3101447 RepID=A0A8T4C5R5_9ARCH|nr:dTDP-glucose 4,6-dehydratase [Candidatus Diapherotrites archaeon]